MPHAPPLDPRVTRARSITCCTRSLPLAAASAPLAAHRQIEALKQAFALRMSIGDPAFVPEAAAVVADMLSYEFNVALHANTSDWATRAQDEYAGRWRVPSGLPRDRGTSHFSIVDRERNAVAVTTTVNTGFGSKLVSNGLVLNNEMDDFSTPGQPNVYGLAPSAANFIQPGKRPLSSMSPTIVLQPGFAADGTPATVVRAVVGASGGPRIISTVLQVLVRALLRGDDAAAAVGLPRLHHQYVPNIVHAEDYEMLDGGWEVVPNATVEGLRLRGHRVERWARHGVAQLVLQDPDTRVLHAVSDRRKGGAPAGY